MIRRLLLAAALLLGPACGTAHGQVVGPTIVIGGPGGGAFTDRCPDGALLVGMNFNGNKDINSVGPVCQKFSYGHAVGDIFGLRTWGDPAGARPTSLGGQFGRVDQIRCPTDMAVEQIKVSVSPAGIVRDYAFVCRNPNAHDYQTTRNAALGTLSARTETTGCGGGAIAVGVIGRYGAMVDGLGLLCLVNAAPPPSRPIKSTARAKVGQPAPPQQSMLAPQPMATATDDVDMYIGPSGETPVLGVWRKGSRARPLASDNGFCKLQGVNNGQDAWVWGEFVSGCTP